MNYDEVAQPATKQTKKPILASRTVIVTDALNRMAQDCMDLANNLHSNGREPDSREKQLIKLAGFAAVKEACEMLQTSYLAGTQTDEALDHIAQQIDVFTV